MKQALMNTYVIAKKIVAFHEQTERGAFSQVQYAAFLGDIRYLIGNDVFEEAYNMAVKMINGEDVFRSSKPRVYEAVVSITNVTGKYRKFFTTMEKAEDYRNEFDESDIKSFEVNERIIES